MQLSRREIIKSDGDDGYDVDDDNVESPTLVYDTVTVQAPLSSPQQEFVAAGSGTTALVDSRH